MVRLHSELISETVSIDEKGRLVLPKKIRQEARISTKSKLVVRAGCVGRIELSDPRVLTRPSTSYRREEACRLEGRGPRSSLVSSLGRKVDLSEAISYYLRERRTGRTFCVSAGSRL